MRDTGGKFKKGSNPWNKGIKGFRPSERTEFKSGEKHTGDKHPSWNGGIQKNKKDCVYLWDGTSKRKRRPVHVWELHHGKISKGHVIYHKDGNKHNDNIENLEMISRGELLRRNNNR